MQVEFTEVEFALVSYKKEMIPAHCGYALNHGNVAPVRAVSSLTLKPQIGRTELIPTPTIIRIITVDCKYPIVFAESSL